MRYLIKLCWVIGLVCLPLAVQAAPYEPSSHTVNKVAAVVNGEMITQFDLEMASVPMLREERLNPRDPANADKVKEVMRRTLETMIVDILVVQEAERLKVTASDDDVQAELKQMVDRSKMSEDALLEQLAKQGMTREQVFERLRKRVLQQRLMGNMVGRKVIVTRDEIAKYFAEHGNSISVGGAVEFAVLIYSPQVRASDWAARIKTGQVEFEDTVRRVSVGPRRQEGGHLDRMPWTDVLPEVRAQLERLAPGQISEVFSMDGLNTQVKLIADHKGNELTTLEEASPVIEERLRGPRLEERYKEYMAQLRKKALVEIRL